MPEINSPEESPDIDQSNTRRSAFSRMLDSVIETGRVILDLRTGGRKRKANSPVELAEQCRALCNHRGEASGLALASEILASYAELSVESRSLFFQILLRDFSVNPDNVVQAAENYRHQPDDQSLARLGKAVESPRLKLFRRLNMAPGGTSALVRLRGQLLKACRELPELKPIDNDLRQLLIAWFNRGFLTLEQISWNSPAAVLERIIAYEAVHEINGWDDLRKRLADDRRCFAFFHPAMPGDPVIFVEVALTDFPSSDIATLIDFTREPVLARDANTATFYSISNCHAGLQGISFGNFLIKQVMRELQAELPGIKTFETLSPIPGFRNWLQSDATAKAPAIADDVRLVTQSIESLDDETAADDELVANAATRLCAHYLLHEKRGDGPLDPVARFHLGNGAALDRLNWNADLSAAGRSRSLGLMVNYAYRPADIEKNHEAYFADNEIAASGALRKLAKY